MADQVIEIRDPEINTEEIMARIRQRIRERRAQAEGRGLDYDRLVDDPGRAESGRLSPDLYYDLHQMRSTADSLWVSVQLFDSHLPLVNSWYMRIKGKLHGIMVDYINRLAGRQVAFNRTTEHVLSGVVHAFEDNDARVEALEKQIAELRDRLAKSEHAQD